MRLEPFGRQHLEAMRAMIGDPDILRFTRIPDPTPPDFLDSWLASYEQRRPEGTAEAFAVLDADDTLLGLALVPSMDGETGECELGYIVAPEARGRGVATALLRELTAWAFEHGAHRCELVIDVENAASERVAERAGYTREGTLRSIHFKGEARIDASLWSRLPSDP